PWMSTVAELSATCCTSVIICFQVGLTPIRLSWPSKSSRRRWSARFCWMRERRSKAWRTTRRSCARWSGLVRESMGPSFRSRAARLFHGAEGGEDDHVHVGRSRFCLLQELEAGKTGHLEVREEEIDATLAKPIEGGLAVVGQHHSVALTGERALEALAHRGVV